MLHFAGLKVPNNVFVHGFITVSGEKMSKSRGTGISPLRYLDIGMNPEWLRYYIAAKLNAKVEDLDFNPDDFVARVNSDLIGKYINIASRCAGFITRSFSGEVSTFESPLLDSCRNASDEISSLYEAREFGKALRRIMEVADEVNGYVATNKPWVLAKSSDQAAELYQVCCTSLEAFRILTLYLKPVLPGLAKAVENFLNIAPLTWLDVTNPLSSSKPINAYSHLMQRVEPKMLDALFDAPAAPNARPPSRPSPSEGEGEDGRANETLALENRIETLAPEINIDDFTKIDLRIARILNCEAVDGSDKLLRLTLDVGEDRPRNVFAGIKSAYQPQDLIGKLTVMVANLAPRKMKFGVSEGMVLAASAADEKSRPGIYILNPWPGAEPGMRVR